MQKVEMNLNKIKFLTSLFYKKKKKKLGNYKHYCKLMKNNRIKVRILEI
jgi:hypothetical protein